MAAAGTLRKDGQGHYYAAGRRHLSPVLDTAEAGDMPAGDIGVSVPVPVLSASPAAVTRTGDQPERWTCDSCHALEAVPPLHVMASRRLVGNNDNKESREQ
jgi:hypothetical protein